MNWWPYLVEYQLTEIELHQSLFTSLSFPDCISGRLQPWYSHESNRRILIQSIWKFIDLKKNDRRSKVNSYVFKFDLLKKTSLSKNLMPPWHYKDKLFPTAAQNSSIQIHVKNLGTANLIWVIFISIFEIYYYNFFLFILIYILAFNWYFLVTFVILFLFSKLERKNQTFNRNNRIIVCALNGKSSNGTHLQKIS